MKRTLLVVIGTLILGTSVQSQSLSPWVVSSGGHYFENGGYTLSGTIGELAVTTLSQGNFVLTQGFQQVFDMGTSIENLNDISWSFVLYPNPVRDKLILHFTLEVNTDMVIEITDVSGRKLLTRNLDNIVGESESVLDISNFSQGMYLLNAYSRDRKISRTVQFHKY